MFLITGSNGYIGTHVVKLLRTMGESCVCMDINLDTDDNVEYTKNCVFYNGDYGNYPMLCYIFKKHPEITTVIHLGALKDVNESVNNPLIYYTYNVSKTISLLNVMKSFDVKNIVFISTSAIYDNNRNLNPISPYGKSKLMIEDILRDDVFFNHIILRLFNVSGSIRYDDPTKMMVLQKFIYNIKKHGVIKVFGTDHETHDGTCIRDYVHVDDVSFVIYEFAKKISETNVFNRTYDIGSGNHTSILDIIDTIKKHATTSFETVFEDKRDGDMPISVSDITDTKVSLNWFPSQKSSLDYIIKELINYYNI